MNSYHHSDQDADDWIDSGFNKKAELELMGIVRVETPDYNSDYSYVTADKVRRYPGFDQRWEIPGGSGVPENKIEVGTVIDERVVTENNDEFLSWVDLQVNNSKHEGNMNWKAPEDETSSNTYTMTFEGGGVFEYKLKFKSIFDYFADPSTSQDDSDGDGLTDAEEYNMSNKPDSYSVDGRAVPTRKDIFVEVDWMDGHEMSDGAKWRVGTRFLNNPTGEEIWLHLDDGLMGGGEEINEKDETAFYLKEGDNNDLWDYKWGNGWYKDNNGNIITGNNPHFSLNRFGKFHYCLFANDADLDDPSITNPTGTHLGVSKSDDFIIGDDNWKADIPKIVHDIFDLTTDVFPPKGNDGEVQGAIFMHELGHHFGLKYTGGIQVGSSDEGYNPDGPVTCMNYYHILSKVKYTSSEWDEVHNNLDVDEGSK